MNVPEPTTAKLVDKKTAAYEKQQAEVEEESRMKSLEQLAGTLMNEGKGASDTGEKEKDGDRLQQSVNTYEQISGQLNDFYETPKETANSDLERKVDVVEDLDGKKTVFIHDILFKGKRAVNWEEVEKYLRQYVGEFYQIEDCNKMIYIGSDLPDEYTHSNYTRILKGANAKVKANAAQGLPELLKIATNEVYEDNRKEKHSKDAKYGWYSYDSRFALPVFSDDGEIERYNVFNVAMLVRHTSSVFMYVVLQIMSIAE